jgi:hypothetical protein
MEIELLKDFGNKAKGVVLKIDGYTANSLIRKGVAKKYVKVEKATTKVKPKKEE